LLGPLLAGVGSVIVPDDEVRDPYALVARLGEHGVTRIWVVPSLLRALLETHADLQERLPALRFWVSSGEALAVGLLEEFQRAMPESRLYNLYGTSEVWDVTWYEAERSAGWQRRVAIGRPIRNMRVYVLDGEGRPVPIGVPGELHVGGVGLARGYIGLRDLTESKFIPDRIGTEGGGRLYKTGDLVRYRENGDLEFLGRLDQQAKIRGFRVELGEIESVLTQHPAVRQSCVIALPDNNEYVRLAAYVVPAGAARPSIPELRTFLQTRLPDYMLPSAIVLLDALPLTSNGKIDRHGLPLPGAIPAEARRELVPPATPTEQALAAIWSQVLGTEAIGIHDNFFELGGDSILSLQIISRANRAGLRLTPRQIFQHQTVAELAAQIEPAAREEGATVTVALTPIQRWFFAQDLPCPHHYNQSILFQVPRSLDAGRTETVLTHLVAHHDALRHRFHRDGAAWLQTIAAPEARAAFSTHDLSGLGRVEQKAEIERISSDLQASLNLEEGPLLRGALFELGKGRRNRLLLVAHHLVVDGVSWRILLEDFETAYRQLSAGEEIALPAKTTSYQRWAERLREYAQTAALGKETEYWEELLRVPAAPLPRDGEGENTVETTASVEVRLDAAETRELLKEVPKAYHTQIQEVLLAALAQALVGWTGERQVRVDVEGHGREGLFEDVDVTRTVGWFTVIYPVMLEWGSGDVGEELKAVKERLRRVPHGGIGYGLLRYQREEAEVEEKLRAIPPAEVVFNYLGQFGRRGSKIGPVAGPRGLRPYLIEINGSVDEGRLALEWSYSEAIHRRSTIARVAAEFKRGLTSLIRHCQSAESVSYTPSDFSASSVSESELQRLISKVGGSEEGWP
jgi:non-ribosomal peptide synthase protein (TIGR01720 family)